MTLTLSKTVMQALNIPEPFQHDVRARIVVSKDGSVHLRVDAYNHSGYITDVYKHSWRINK